MLKQLQDQVKARFRADAIAILRAEIKCLEGLALAEKRLGHTEPEEAGRELDKLTARVCQRLGEYFDLSYFDEFRLMDRSDLEVALQEGHGLWRVCLAAENRAAWLRTLLELVVEDSERTPWIFKHWEAMRLLA